jgi:mycothiol synthase
VTSHGRPVAVMLLNLVPQRRSAELVYLGIAPAWRGKGLGRRLLQHGLSVTHRHGASSLSLAVDDQNAPAVRLYESLRFSPHARKRAMIFTVG